MKHKIYIIMMLTLSMVFIFGCKTSEDVTDSATDPNTITISENSFGPATITVTAGTTLRWVNRGNAVHTVTSGTRGNPDGMFNSGDMTNGNTFQYTFNTVGTYQYYCAYHVGMDGVVIVQ